MTALAQVYLAFPENRANPGNATSCDDIRSNSAAFGRPSGTAISCCHGPASMPNNSASAGWYQNTPNFPLLVTKNWGPAVPGVTIVSSTK